MKLKSEVISLVKIGTNTKKYRVYKYCNQEHFYGEYLISVWGKTVFIHAVWFQL